MGYLDHVVDISHVSAEKAIQVVADRLKVLSDPFACFVPGLDFSVFDQGSEGILSILVEDFKPLSVTKIVGLKYEPLQYLAAESLTIAHGVLFDGLQDAIELNED